jgi:hypothetical protein
VKRKGGRRSFLGRFKGIFFTYSSSPIYYLIEALKVSKLTLEKEEEWQI